MGFEKNRKFVEKIFSDKFAITGLLIKGSNFLWTIYV
jgi:hypothetical protein